MKLDNRPSVFRVNTIDLGTEDFIPEIQKDTSSNVPNVYKEDIDSIFTDDDPSSTCYICRDRATHRIIPKPGVPLTMWLEKYGYICDSCLLQGHLDSNNYGIRKLAEDTFSSLI